MTWELDYKESWVPKNWCFWTVVLEKALESPLDCKEINQSILKEISPGCSLEGLMLKLKLQYFGHLMWRADSFEIFPWCWERLRAGGEGDDRGEEGDDRGWDGWMASPTRSTWVWASSGSWWWTRRPGVLQSMRSQRAGHDWATELNWTGPLLAAKNKLKVEGNSVTCKKLPPETLSLGLLGCCHTALVHHHQSRQCHGHYHLCHL